MNQTAQTRQADLSRMYDQLCDADTATDWPGSVRKTLQNAPGGAPLDHRQFDLWLGDLFRLAHGENALDIGCGNGATLLTWLSRWKGDHLGLTISPAQTAMAREWSEKLSDQLKGHCRFETASFDDPRQEEFDVLVSLETLIHSAAPRKTLECLLPQLRAHGRIGLVEDLLVDEAVAEDRDLKILRDSWYCGSGPLAISDVRLLLKENGFRILEEKDLTSQVKTRPLPVASLIGYILRLAETLPIGGGLHSKARAFRGGMALERLYRRGVATYRVIVAERNDIES